MAAIPFEVEVKFPVAVNVIVAVEKAEDISTFDWVTVLNVQAPLASKLVLSTIGSIIGGSSLPQPAVNNNPIRIPRANKVFNFFIFRKRLMKGQANDSSI